MKIQVTEKHIRKGIPDDCTKCAVALALQDALKGYNLFNIEIITDYDNNALMGKFKFNFKEHLSIDGFQFTKITPYTISQTDEVKVNHFINEFDTFGYDKGKQESIPRYNVVDAKPFTFELGGEIERQTVLSHLQENIK